MPVAHAFFNKHLYSSIIVFLAVTCLVVCVFFMQRLECKCKCIIYKAIEDDEVLRTVGKGTVLCAAVDHVNIQGYQMLALLDGGAVQYDADWFVVKSVEAASVVSNDSTAPELGDKSGDLPVDGLDSSSGVPKGSLCPLVGPLWVRINNDFWG